MKISYDGSDIKKLDFIIDCVLNSDYPRNSDCIEKSDLFHELSEEDIEFEFQRLLMVIDHFNLATVTTGDYWCIEKNFITKRHKNDGGFYPVFKKLEEEEKRKQKQIQKEDTDHTLTKWKYYTFWPLLVIAVLGGGYTTYDFIKRLSKPKTNQELQTTKGEKVSERSKLRTLPLNQKSQDSSFQTSFDKETSTQKRN